MREPEPVAHWSVDTATFAARDPEGYERWALEERINFGLRGTKLSRRSLERWWDVLHLDSDRRRYLSFLLWG